MRGPVMAAALGFGLVAPAAGWAADSDTALPVLAPVTSAAAEATPPADSPADTGAPAAPAAPLHGPMKSLRGILNSHRGEPVLLTIWATWCGPCIKEIPILNEAARRFKDDGLHVIGVSVDSLSADSDEAGLSAVTKFLGEHEVSYPAFYYEGDANLLGNAIGWTGVVPFNVIFDARGKIVERIPGAVNEGNLFSRLSELLRDSAAKSRH